MLLLLLSCDTPSAPGPLHWEQVGVEASLDDLPAGTVTMRTATHAYVWPEGLFLHDGTPAGEGLRSPLLEFLNPRARAVPQVIEGEWMAAAGGLYRSTDGLAWELVDLSTSGSSNLLFTDVDVDGDRVAAVSMLPTSILPSEYDGLLGGTLFQSEDGGATWTAEEGASLYATSVVFGDRLYVGTMDQGVLGLEGGPSDVVALDWQGGCLLVGSATRGLWLYEDGAWTQAGEGAVRSIQEGRAVLADGTVWELAEGEGSSPPEEGGATVHIALSFHVNYYHSYRGDSPTDDGYGLDIEVIRNTLDWLDEHPRVHADWDSDNAFTTDDWMVQDSPDILERIAARVASGQDDVRLMSWNNGAMASSSREEFEEAVQRGIASNVNAFGEMVPGVQPQECMFTPEHLAWYPELGIDWVTLFYSATGFTALRSDLELSGSELTNPFTLTRDGASMTTVPVYHHADMLDHGGLSGWARQLHATESQDQLLVIHFDADAESWERFDDELTAVEQLDFVEFTTIADYLADHEPVSQHELPGDVADGNGDGFSSWAEKHFNHDIATVVALSRERADQARLLGADEELLASSLEWRLLALSTTNYGLAAPLLHEDRIESATLFAESSLAEAEAALEELPAPEPGTIELVNARDSAGPALVTLELPTQSLRITLDGEELPWRVTDEGLVELVVEVAAQSVTVLEWEEASPASATGFPELIEALQPPFSECAGERSEGSERDSGSGADSLSAWSWTEYALDTCGEAGSVKVEQRNYAGLPGTVVRVDASLGGEVDLDLESVVLSPLACEDARTLRWRGMGGGDFERPARAPVRGWNGQAADGWVELDCGGETLVVAHRVTERTSLAFAPLRNDGEQAVLAPLGTMWDPGPWHDARRTGGHGLGELVTFAVGSQFRPQAPDWMGQETRYRLLVAEGELDEQVRDLFAHPPLVRVGAAEELR